MLYTCEDGWHAIDAMSMHIDAMSRLSSFWPSKLIHTLTHDEIGLAWLCCMVIRIVEYSQRGLTIDLMIRRHSCGHASSEEEDIRLCEELSLAVSLITLTVPSDSDMSLIKDAH